MINVAVATSSNSLVQLSARVYGYAGVSSFYVIALTPPSGLELEDLWQQPSCWVFVPEGASVGDTELFADAVIAALKATSASNVRWLAWVTPTSPTTVTVQTSAPVQPAGSGDSFQVVRESTFPFGQVELVVGASANVPSGPSGASPLLTMQPVDGRATIALRVKGINITLGLDAVTVSFDPAYADTFGTLGFVLAQTDPAQLFRLWADDPVDFTAWPSAEIRYYGAGPAGVLRYPYYPARKQYPPGTTGWGFDARLDPLAPTHPTRSRFAFDPTGFAPPATVPPALTFNTPSGAIVELTPLPDAGLGLSTRTDGLYLVPAGGYAVGAAGASSEGTVTIMTGLSGTEFFLVQTADGTASADELWFTPDLPGHIDPSARTLGPATTTSYVQAVSSRHAVPGAVGSSYCVVPTGSVYFRKDGTRYTQPSMAGCRLFGLATAASGAPTAAPAPMTPYTLVYHTDEQGLVENPNPDVTPAEFASVEQVVLQPNRRAILRPSFDNAEGPQFFALSSLAPLDGGYVMNGTGLLLSLNPAGGAPTAGTVSQILVAQSPSRAQQFLAFGPPPGQDVVVPSLVNTMSAPDLFLVCSGLPATSIDEHAGTALLPLLGQLSFTLSLGEFAYDLLPSAYASGSGGAILVFKLAAGVTLRSLLADTTTWTDADTYALPDPHFHTPANPTGSAAGRIQAFLAETDLPAFVTAILDDPTWTGAIALDVPVNYSQLPLDLKVILGGVRNQPLCARLVGVSLSRLDLTASTAEAALQQSSMFSVIDYRDDIDHWVGDGKTTDYWVSRLSVIYQNSVMTEFTSQLELCLPTLFGSQLALGSTSGLPPFENRVSIPGTYQTSGGAGRVVFDTTAGYTFAAAAAGRVIEGVTLADVLLVPVSETDNADGTTTVAGAFSLGGTLDLLAIDGLDIFSYGGAESGLPFTTYQFGFTTTLRGNIATPTSGPTDDITRLAFQADAARDGSLAATLPVTLTGLDWATAPNVVLTPANVNWTVTSLSSDRLGSGFSPVLAFEYSLALGTLGALGGGSDLVAPLLLGWVPGSGSSADKLVVWLQPPASSFDASSFQVQGVFDVSFRQVQLNALTLVDGSSILAVVFPKAVVSLFGLGLTQNDLTLFGDPSNPKSTMYWYQSAGNTAAVGQYAFLQAIPIFSVGIGIDVKVDLTSFDMLGDALDTINQLPSTVPNLLQAIDDGTNVSLNSDAGGLVAIQLDYMSVSFQALFDDPSFYGAVLTLGDPEPPPEPPGEGGDVAGAKDESNPLMQVLGGLTIGILYARISDGLGVWSVNFTLPKKFREFKVGAATVQLPSIAVDVYTNGDFRFAVGWPPDGDGTLQVQFQAGPLPLQLGGGFYFGKLRGSDFPDTFGKAGFGIIYEVGIGLNLGLGKDFEAGPVSLSLQAYATLTFQGFFASSDGTITADGQEYYWVLISLGITLKASGSLDLKIIDMSLDLSANITFSVAIETDHATGFTIVATFTVEATFRLLFIKIHFSFTFTVTLLDTTLGSGPAAEMSGPTPGALLLEPRRIAATPLDAPVWAFLAPEARAARAFVRGEPIRTVQPGVRRYQGLRARAATCAASSRADVTTLPLVAVLQAAACASSTGVWTPYAVATLAVCTDDAGSVPAPFTQLVSQVVEWVVQAAEADPNPPPVTWLFNSATPSADVKALALALAWLQAGRFDDRVDDCVNAEFAFTVRAAVASDASANMAAFPMVPGLSLGGDFGFPGAEVSASYVSALALLFGAPKGASAAVTAAAARLRAARRLRNPLGFAESGSEPLGSVIFDDWFVAVARQAVQDLLSMMDPGQPSPSTPTTLAQALADYATGAIPGFAIGNASGLAGRFLLNGLQIPTPTASGDMPADPAFESLYLLLGQEVSVPAGQDFDTTITLAATRPVTVQLVDQAGQPVASVPLDLPAAQILVPTTLPTLPWTITATPPLTTVAVTFGLGSPSTWGANDVLWRLPEQASGAWVQGASAAIDLQAALAVNVELVPVTVNGAAVPGVFQLSGADPVTRAQLALVLASGGTPTVTVLVATGAGAYRSTSAAPSDTLLVKTNLSTDSVPPSARAALAAAPPVEVFVAAITDAADFLQLVWEASVVNTPGFNLSLPGETFAATTNAILLVTVAPASPVQEVPAWADTLVSKAATTLQIALVQDATGTPVTTATPYLPAGAVGYTIAWTGDINPDTSDPSAYVEALYQIVQSRITSISGAPGISSEWTPPVSASGAPGSYGFANTQSVAQLLAPGESPYGAVGHEATTEVRVLDVFGNALPDALAGAVTAEVVYNDVLVTPAQWPGVNVAYSVGGASAAPALGLNFGLVSGFTATTSTVETWSRIVNQLSDPNVTLSVATTLAAAPLTTLSDGAGAQAVLVAFAGRMLAYVTALLRGDTVEPPPNFALTFTLDAAWPATLPYDLLPIEASIGLVRAGVKPDVAAALPLSASATCTLVPSLPDDADQPSLSDFAQAFEAAYRNYDGKGGMLKLAGSSSVIADGGDPAGLALEALRWASPSGVQATVTGAPVYLAPVPLSTQLRSRSVDVRKYISTTWTGTGADVVGDAPVSFTNVDMDAWAAATLVTIDGLFTPTQSAALAATSTDAYAALAAARETLADAISGATALAQGNEPLARARLDVVFQGADADLGAAVETWRQALLASIGNAYAVTTLVQVPVSVAIAGAIEPHVDPAYPPQLYGKVTVAGGPDAANAKQYSFSSGRLNLATDTTSFTTLLSTTQVLTRSSVELDLAFDFQFLQHDRDAGAAFGAYVPSSWLTFVVADATTTLSLGATDIPLPLRAFPAAPTLASQAAAGTGTGGDTPVAQLQSALQWGYTVDLTTGASRDELVVAVTFNQAPATTATGARFARFAAMGDGDPPRPPPADLFEALARFQYEYPQLAPHVADLASLTPAVAQRVVQRLQQLVAWLGDTWPSWTSAAPDALLAASGPITTWSYVLAFDIDAGTIEVTQPNGATNPLPTLDGVRADEKGVYAWDGHPALSIAWGGLSVLQQQSATASVYTVRNANLGDLPVNPVFVYQTAPVAFANPMVPSLAATDVITISEATAQAAIATLFGAFPAGDFPTLRFQLGTGYNYTLVPAQGPGQAGVNVVLPMFLTQEDDTFVATGSGRSLTQFQAEWTADVNQWHGDHAPVSTGAALNLGMTLYANISSQQLPLVQFPSLLLTVAGDGWWNPEESA